MESDGSKAEGTGLTPQGGAIILTRWARGLHPKAVSGGVQADVATQETTASPGAWVRITHADRRRQAGAQPAAAEGEAPADSVSLLQHARRYVDHIPRREQRLRRRSEFEALRKPTVSRANPIVVLRAVPNSLSHARFGFIVGRRVAKQAVARNRVRRWLRESVRLTGVQPGWDLLFIARSLAVDAGFKRVSESVREVVRRAKLAKSTQGDAEVPESRA